MAVSKAINKTVLQAIIDFRDATGRKFSAGDVTQDAVRAATEYLADYSGDFAFVLEMKRAIAGPRGLSNAQWAGVLNCLAADAKGEAKAVALATPDKVSAPVEVVVAPRALPEPGTYTVAFGADDANGEWYETLKLETPDWGPFEKGTLAVSYLHGPDNELDFTGFAFIKPDGNVRTWGKYTGKLADQHMALETLLRLTAEGRSHAGMEYAMRSGRCCRCGRKLTVPASLFRGMGPRCAGKE